MRIGVAEGMKMKINSKAFWVRPGTMVKLAMVHHRAAAGLPGRWCANQSNEVAFFWSAESNGRFNSEVGPDISGFGGLGRFLRSHTAGDNLRKCRVSHVSCSKSRPVDQNQGTSFPNNNSTLEDL